MVVSWFKRRKIKKLIKDSVAKGVAQAVEEIKASDEYKWQEAGIKDFFENGNFVGLSFLDDPNFNADNWKPVDFIERGKRLMSKKSHSTKGDS